MSNQPRQPKDIPPAQGNTVGANEEGKPAVASDEAGERKPTGTPDSDRDRTERAAD